MRISNRHSRTGWRTSRLRRGGSGNGGAPLTLGATDEDGPQVFKSEEFQGERTRLPERAGRHDADEDRGTAVDGPAGLKPSSMAGAHSDRNLGPDSADAPELAELIAVERLLSAVTERVLNLVYAVAS